MTSSHQDGQALIESILVGLLLMLPLVWALGVLGDLHRGALAATAAAREAGFDAARSSSPAAARVAADAAAVQAFADQGLEPAHARVRLAPARLARGEAVEVEVTYPVTVLQAPLIGRVAGPSVLVEARHVARVDPFRSRP